MQKKIKIKQYFILIPFAIIYSLFIVLGNWEETVTRSTLQNVGSLLLWTVGSLIVLAAVCTACGLLKDKREREGKWYIYAVFFLICVVSYLPYFLMHFPTWLNNDAVWQLEQALGWTGGSNHHPYFHTMLIKCLFMVGFRLFGTHIAGAATYTLWQLLVMAAAYAGCLYILYKKGVRMIWLVLAILFYAVLPINGMLSICMGKDGLFAVAMLFFMWTLERLSDGKRDIKIWDYAFFGVAGILLCLLRSNGFFVFGGTAFFLILKIFFRAKKEAAKTLAATVLVMLCYMLYKGPVLDAMHVTDVDTIEGLTMPTQHLLCAYVNGGELTEEEIQMLNEVVPMDQVASYYNPYFFDIVKNYIRDAGNQQVIADNKGKYFKLWLGVGLRNPLQYLEAEVKQTMGFWSYKLEDYQFWIGEYFMVDNSLGIETQRKLFTYDDSLRMYTFLMGFQDIMNKVWSLGRNVWLLLLAFAVCAYRKRRCILFVPSVMLMLTILLATPVYNVFRYEYAMFVALPLLLEVAFGRKIKQEDEKHEEVA